MIFGVHDTNPVSRQLVTTTAVFLVDSIDGLTSTGKISKEFVGLVLLPLIGNTTRSYTALSPALLLKSLSEHIAEHMPAIGNATKDKLDASIRTAVGSTIVRGVLYLHHCMSTADEIAYVANLPLHHPVRNALSVFKRLICYVADTYNTYCPRFLTILAWSMDKPLTFLFDPYESIVLFLSGTVYTYQCLRTSFLIALGKIAFLQSSSFSTHS